MLGWGDVKYGKVWSPACRKKWSLILGQNLGQGVLASLVEVRGMLRGNLAEG